MSSSVRINGVDVATTVDGTGERGIVLSHGTPFSSVVWEPVIGALTPHGRVFRWDMPGYGESMTVSHPVDLDTQAARLVALIEHWELDRPTLVAHDIGGAVALRAHLVHGLELEQLVLVDAVCLQPWGSPIYRLIQAHAPVFGELPAAFHRVLVETYLGGVTVRALTAAETGRLAAPWLGEDGQRAFYRQIEQVRRSHTDDLVDRLGSMRCPVDVVWGASDGWLPVEIGRRLADALGTALIEIPDAGHLVMFDQPDLVAAALSGVVTRSA